MSYNELTAKIASLHKDLDLASSNAERNYFEMEILVAEEVLERGLGRARDIMSEMR